jgi:Glycosyltransferase (GlcNAc)
MAHLLHNFCDAAGFMFGSGLVLSEVPFDPELPFLFDGEEVRTCIPCQLQKCTSKL